MEGAGTPATRRLGSGKIRERPLAQKKRAAGGKIFVSFFSFFPEALVLLYAAVATLDSTIYSCKRSLSRQRPPSPDSQRCREPRRRGRATLARKRETGSFPSTTRAKTYKETGGQTGAILPTAAAASPSPPLAGSPSSPPVLCLSRLPVRLTD